MDKRGENTQQVEEEVDEVEIQCQGSDESQLLSTLAHIVLSLEHHLDPVSYTHLDVYKRQAYIFVAAHVLRMLQLT